MKQKGDLDRDKTISRKFEAKIVKTVQDKRIQGRMFKDSKFFRFYQNIIKEVFMNFLPHGIKSIAQEKNYTTILYSNKLGKTGPVK